MKKDYTFSFLRAQDIPHLHQTFLKAFADYLIPIQLSTEQFDAKIKREGIVPSFCVAAYAGEEMAGFILTGLGEWQGEPTAYNAGTGVIPGHRGKQLTKQLYQFLIPKLRESGVTQCLLEVIQENKPALEAYKSIGFKIIRSADSFRATKEKLILPATAPDAITIAPATKPDWAVYHAFYYLKPTWQNTATAFGQFPAAKFVLEARTATAEVVGFVAFLVGNGAILQLAVHPHVREQGIGTALLRAVAEKTESPALMLINIDTEAVDFVSFLNRRHFRRFLGQYEMLLPTS